MMSRLPIKKTEYEFKYILIGTDGHVEWESGPNRFINVSADGRVAVDPHDPLPHRVRHHSNQQLGTFELMVHHTCSKPSHVVAILGDAEVRAASLACCSA